MIHDCVVYHVQAPVDKPHQSLCPSLDPEPDTANLGICPVLHFLLSFSDLQYVVLEIWRELYIVESLPN